MLFCLWFTQSHLAVYINYNKLKLSNSLSNRQHKIYLYIIYIYNIRYSYAYYSGSVAHNGPIGNRWLNYSFRKAKVNGLMNGAA